MEGKIPTIIEMRYAMEKTHEGKQWYGFTEDQVFGEVMSGKDEQHNFYNLEMQTTDQKDLGKRLRYYGSQDVGW